MKILILILLVFLSTSCGHKAGTSVGSGGGVMPSNAVPFSTYSCGGLTCYYAGTDDTRRIYFFSGFEMTHNQTNNDPNLLSLLNNLLGRGYQVVTFDIPVEESSQAVIDAFPDAGQQYRAYWVSLFNTIVSDTNTALGVAQTTIGFGISFGGLHCLMTAALTDHFDTYVAYLPLINIFRLTSFGLENIDNSDFNPLNVTSQLQSKPGLILWGEHDMTVDFHDDVQLYDKLVSIGAPVVGVALPNDAHSTSASGIKAIEDYLQ